MSPSKQQQIFITGGSGFLGSVVIESAVAEGFLVHALSRSKESDEKLKQLGAFPVRGDLTSHDVLASESKAADIIFSLATAYVLGRGPYADALPTDDAVIDTIASAIVGTNKPLIITNGTLVAQGDGSGNETHEDAPIDSGPLGVRAQNEQHALSKAGYGVRVMSIRVAAYTYGRGGSGIKQFMGMASHMGSIFTIEGGKNYVTATHVEDTAKLYLLAAQKGKAGDIFNAGAATDITAKEIYETIAAAVGVQVVDLSYEEAVSKFGESFAWFIRADNRASGDKARKQLGWEPKGKGVLEEIRTGSYVEVARALKKN